MHCKSCLKVSKYFSKCMHPYCEKCFDLQEYCTLCETGKIVQNKKYNFELFRASFNHYVSLFYGK